MHRCRHLRSVAFVQLQPFVRLGMKREELEELEELEGPAERAEVAKQAEVEEQAKELFCTNRVSAHGGIHYHSSECRDGEPLISLNNITKNYGARDAEGSAVVLALKEIGRAHV